MGCDEIATKFLKHIYTHTHTHTHTHVSTNKHKKANRKTFFLVLFLTATTMTTHTHNYHNQYHHRHQHSNTTASYDYNNKNHYYCYYKSLERKSPPPPVLSTLFRTRNSPLEHSPTLQKDETVSSLLANTGKTVWFFYRTAKESCPHMSSFFSRSLVTLPKKVWSGSIVEKGINFS
jgi:hypothetical protein